VTLATLFPEAEQISLAVAVVPDPLVPRYRRLYDHHLVAIELGMLRSGYVLDRFYLPWNEQLRAAGESKDKSLPFNRGAYGLLLFRCDAWRSVPGVGPSVSKCGSSSGTRFRALYIVTDTSTKGVESRAFRCVVDRIASQLPNALAADQQSHL